MTDTNYIYGEGNGASYERTTASEGELSIFETRTHWDSRIEIKAIAGTVQVGIIPSSREKSTDDHGIWDGDDGQFLSLSRGGLNRLIAAVRECRDEAYGKDQ